MSSWPNRIPSPSLGKTATIDPKKNGIITRAPGSGWCPHIDVKAILGLDCGVGIDIWRVFTDHCGEACLVTCRSELAGVSGLSPCICGFRRSETKIADRSFGKWNTEKSADAWESQ